MNIGDDFFERLRGSVIPQHTGTYTFWISSDDHSELWLSTTASKFDRRRIAWLEGSSGRRNWDQSPTQKSVGIELMAGQSYFVEVLHKEGAVDDHVELAWQEPGGTRGIIPASCLESYGEDPNDLDRDELPDDWELAHGLTVGAALPGQGPLDDPDADGYDNLTEASYGTPPLVHSRIPGALSVDLWDGIRGERLETLTWHPRFFAKPDRSFLVSTAAIAENQGDNFGGRIRGLVTAPVTGEYVFYIAGDDDCELWLSDSQSQFAAERIAGFQGATNVAEWTRYPGQRSVAISLEAGRSYYIEGLLKEGWGGDHLEIGWTVPGGSTIEIIPGTALASHAYDPGDPDGDGLPSAWELAHGLDPASAAGDQGAAGDPDGDAIANALEYRFDLDPQVKGSLAGAMSREKWNDVGGNLLEPFRVAGGFWTAPSQRSVIHGTKPPANDGDVFVARTRAWITAPATGDYIFWIASDDESELWLSPTASKFGRTRIASIVHSGDQNWEVSPTQQSVAIHLEEGQRYFIEALHKEGYADDYFAIAWQVPGGGRELIPPSALESFSFDPNDVDNDDLRDDWELAHGFSLTDNGVRYPDQHPLADPDGDGVKNLDESALNTSPLDRIRSEGKLTLEIWENINGLEVAQLTANSRFAGPADHKERVDSAFSGTDRGDNYGSRLRGVVIPPVTGDYTFYVAGDDHCELWLSPSESQFEKEKIAWFKGATGVAQWDLFPTQRSVTKSLVAGQKYYIEALHKEAVGGDHVEIGWSLSGSAVIEIIPGSALASHTKDVSDPDGDELPTAWELANGFDPMKADGVDGGAGDPDRDGILNWAEYAHGSDPNTRSSLAGMMLREVWNEIPGKVVANLTGTPRYYEAPDYVGLVYGAEAPYSWGDNYAQRLRGILTAPATGDYTFWVSSDDQSELWLSTGESKIGRRKIASCDGVVNGQSWDVFPAQKSRTIHLVAGQRYFIEAVHKEGPTGDHLEIGWLPPGGSRQIVPGSVLESYVRDLNDLDEDELPDDWETTHGFDAATAEGGDHAPLADPDGDGVPNWAEALAGADPFAAAPVSGFLALERWNAMPFYSVRETTGADKFFAAPDVRTVIADGNTGHMDGDYFATRARGYLVAPRTGVYQFWLTANTSGELWLSTDQTKYAKRRIARIDPEVGTGQGVVLTDVGAPWDVYSSQMSEPVSLVAGRKYFIEVLHQRGHGNEPHFGVAWAINGGDREILPYDALASYAPEAADADDDYLPDAWETLHGLDPQDNGAGDRERQGERGDFDADGLSNRAEYLMGGNPLDPQPNPGTTDGEVIGGVDLGQPVASDSPLIETETGVITSSFRGGITWNFTVPSAGYWMLRTTASLKGLTASSETVSLRASIDGQEVERAEVLFLKDQTSVHRLLTPRLTAGMHTFTLFADNHIARHQVELRSIEVVTLAGSDSTGAGIPDWAQQRLGNANSVSEHATYSCVSPFFVEGVAREPQAVDLTVIQRSGEVNRLYRYNPAQWEQMLSGFEQRLAGYENSLIQQLRAGGNRMEGIAVGHQRAPGRDGWFTKLVLSRNEAVGYVSLFEHLGVAEHGIVVWTPRNVLSGGELTVAAGSQVLLGAWDGDWDWQTVTLQVAGQTFSFPAAQSHVQTFADAGEYDVVATHPTGLTGTLRVKVLAADFGGDVQAAQQDVKLWNLPDVPAALTVDAGREVIVSHIGAPQPPTGQAVLLQPHEPGTHVVAARLPDTREIVATAQVKVVGVSDAMHTGGGVATGMVDGMWLVRTPMILTDLPPGGYARIVIFRAGVMFEDGSTERIIRQADLDAAGVFYVNFLFPTNIGGGYCHYIEIYDAAGNLLRKR